MSSALIIEQYQIWESIISAQIGEKILSNWSYTLALPPLVKGSQSQSKILLYLYHTNYKLDQPGRALARWQKYILGHVLL